MASFGPRIFPAYAKAGFPVIALADSAIGKAAELASEKNIPHAFDSIEQAVRFAPADAIFDIAVPATQIMTILPQLPSGAAVLIQKPMGETLEEATLIRDLCRRRGLVAAVNFPAEILAKQPRRRRAPARPDWSANCTT